MTHNFFIFLVAIVIVSTTKPAVADVGWPVDKAILRYELEISGVPTVIDAGAVAILPDGGLLPRPFAEPVVISENGTTILRCETLWHNTSAGMGIVFEAPAQGAKVTVYLRQAQAMPPPGGKSYFKPGLLLFTRTTAAPTLEMAVDMGQGRPIIGTDIMMGQVKNIGQRWNQFGLDDNYLSYYTGWITIDKQKRAYIATISDEGSELHIDGRSIASWPGIHTRDAGARGEFGSWVDLSPGLHKIDYFHFERTGLQEAHALWTFNSITKENKPKTIPEMVYVQSATARVIRGEYRDGRPVVTVSAASKSYLWLGKNPVNLYHLETALTEGNPNDTIYNWIISDQSPMLSSKSFVWLIEKTRETPLPITLSAVSKSGTTTILKQLLMWPGPPAASINSAADRQIYRDAFMVMCRAVPTGADPASKWSDSMWATLLGVVEPYKGDELVLEIMTRSRKSFLSMKPETRRLYEDIFMEAIRKLEPAVTVTWLDRMEQDENDRDRKFFWKQMRVDYFLNDRGDTNEARRLANQLAAGAVDAEEIIVAAVRQGDVARAQGNYDEARRLYSQAQDRFRDYKRNVVAAAQTVRKPVGLARNKEELKAQQKMLLKASTPSAALGFRQPPASWKTFAVREASFYAEAKKLIQDGFFFEARDILRTWELEFPLCKLSGDYPLAEAEYFIAANRYERALRTLELYQKGIDLSSTLPEAWALQLDCLEKLKRDKEARSLAKDIVKRLPNHPLAERARRIVQSGI